MRGSLAIWVLAVFAFARGQTAPQTDSQQQRVQLTTVSETHIISYNVFGKRFEISIDEKQVSNSPPWSRPTAKQPPLSIAKAIHIAEQAVRKYVEDPAQWRLDAVALRSIGTQSKWYYLIRWYPVSKGYIGDGIDIAVLMNGVLVEPTVKPESTQ